MLNKQIDLNCICKLENRTLCSEDMLVGEIVFCSYCCLHMDVQACFNE